MKIPGERENQGYDRLQFYKDTVQACFYSQKKRAEQYDLLKNYYLFGSSPEDYMNSPYNKIDPIVDTLTAFLYSADSTRFLRLRASSKATRAMRSISSVV